MGPKWNPKSVQEQKSFFLSQATEYWRVCSATPQTRFAIEHPLQTSSKVLKYSFESSLDRTIYHVDQVNIF